MTILDRCEPTAVERETARQYELMGFTESAHDMNVSCYSLYYGAERHERRTNGSCRCGLYVAVHQTRLVSIWNWLVRHPMESPTEYLVDEPLDDPYTYSTVVRHMQSMDREAIPPATNGSYYEYECKDREGNDMRISVVIDYWKQVHRVMQTQVVDK